MVYFKANQVEAASKDVEGAFSGPRECGWQVPSSKFQSTKNLLSSQSALEVVVVIVILDIK